MEGAIYSIKKKNSNHFRMIAVFEYKIHLQTYFLDLS
jgi:hypothetical protein